MDLDESGLIGLSEFKVRVRVRVRVRVKIRVRVGVGVGVKGKRLGLGPGVRRLLCAERAVLAPCVVYSLCAA